MASAQGTMQCNLKGFICVTHTNTSMLVRLLISIWKDSTCKAQKPYDLCLSFSILSPKLPIPSKALAIAPFPLLLTRAGSLQALRTIEAGARLARPGPRMMLARKSARAPTLTLKTNESIHLTRCHPLFPLPSPAPSVPRNSMLAARIQIYP